MKALIISMDYFPDGGAGALRQKMTGKLLMESGYQVSIIGYRNGRYSDTDDKMEYVFLPDNKTRIVSRIFNIIYKYQQEIRKYLVTQLNQPDIIILTTTMPLGCFQFVKKYARDNNIRLIYDCVEWFSLKQVFRHYSPLNMFISYAMNNIEIVFMTNNNINVLSISKYLQKYFTNRDINSYYLPVVMDIVEFTKTFIQPSNSQLNLIYAGSPGSKDYIKEVIDALMTLDESEYSRLIFNIFGVTAEELSKMTGISTNMLSNMPYLKIYGRIPRNEVLKYYLHADFSIIIRSAEERYSKAGFPTKAIEGLMLYTPLLLNMTSDLGDYLKDGYDCIEVEAETTEYITRALRRALALTPKEKDQMKINARKTAEKSFDYRLYIESFGKFVGNLD